MEIAGSVCLVTGAGGGIGRATVRALAAAGGRVVAADRPGASLDGLPAEAVLTHDLSVPGAAGALAAEAETALGRVDVLVNNAGAGLYGGVDGLEPGESERLLTLNLSAPIELTRSLLPGMLVRERGHVVNVGSIVGFVGRANEAVYAAGKGGLTVFTESLRSELHGRPVGASLVAPVVVDTRYFTERGAPYDRRWPRPVQPERIAGAILEAIRSDRARVIVPRWLAVVVQLHGAAPTLFRALADRLD